MNAISKILKDKGVSFFAISPQTKDNNRELIEKLRLDFEILNDAGNQFANSIDLVHGFEPELKDIYLELGADLSKSNGDSSWTLPIPSRIIVGGDHHVMSIQYNADYKVRPEPEELLTAFE